VFPRRKFVLLSLLLGLGTAYEAPCGSRGCYVHKAAMQCVPQKRLLCACGPPCNVGHVKVDGALHMIVSVTVAACCGTMLQYGPSHCRLHEDCWSVY
jgi:hypothetical protein